MKTFIVLFALVMLSADMCSAQNWVQTLNGRNVWSLAKDDKIDMNGDIYAGGLTGNNSRIWKSTDGGNSWDTIYTGTGATMWDFGFDESGSIYVANFSNGLLISTNNGVNFSVIPISVFNNKNTQGVECGSGGHVFVTTSSGFFRSTDFGQTFTETALTGLNCLPVIVDKDSLNIVYVGVSSAGGTGIGCYRSTDNGLTFSNNLNPGKNGYGLAHDDHNDIIYMITTTAPYNFDKSTNNGLTWTTMGNLSGAQRGVAPALLDNSIFTAGNGGVFKSTNGGANFANHNLTLSVTPILTVNFNNVLKVLAGASGSTSGGVWMFTEGIIQGVENQSTNTGTFHLQQNYPNPFNPSTVIKFDVTKQAMYELIVFDALGNRAASLLDKELNPGSYEITFDGMNLPSGIYFYKLTNDENFVARKMLLMK